MVHVSCPVKLPDFPSLRSVSSSFHLQMLAPNRSVLRRLRFLARPLVLRLAIRLADRTAMRLGRILHATVDQRTATLGRLPQQLQVDTLSFDHHRGKGFGGQQQLVSRLSHQRQSGRDGDVTDDMRGVLQTQAVFHHSLLSGHTDHLIENLAETVSPQASTKVAQRAGIR